MNYKMAKAHGNRLRWTITKDDIKKSTEKLIAEHRLIYDAVGSVKVTEVTYASVVKPLIDSDREYEIENNNIDFVQHVFEDKELRDASVVAVKKLSEFDVEMSMRQDVFDLLVAFEKTGMEGLSKEVQRYIERQIIMGKRNGLHLPKATQDKIRSILVRISELEIDFNKNLNEENTVLQFAEFELDGLPEDFLKSLERTADNKYKVTLQYPHYFPCMKRARKPETRKKMEFAFSSRCMQENTPILEELIKLRHEKAQLLGYPNHASLMLDITMSKTPENVASFVKDLAEKLQPLKKRDLDLFLQYKKEDCFQFGYEFDNKICIWDCLYYSTVVEEKQYSVDHNKLKEYFPMEVVTKGLLEIYQELLGLEFKLIEGVEVWHPDVTMYSVTDKDSQDLLGYFYLDLFPREGKYGHAACFSLQPGCLNSDGTRMIAVVAMVANFTKPTKDQSSLLMHEEVETFFHEFGHAMHQICAQSEVAFFSGTNVERDFVEAPSQMLENWCWEKGPLIRMSAHYKDGSSIPDDLLDNLIQSRKANAGVVNMRQILLTTFDQAIHTQAQVDTATLFSNLSEQLLGFSPSPGTNRMASFGHLAGDYDAQYYGYLWSEVFSMDMFATRFKKEGIMNSKTGADYRRCILQPGGSLDGDVMLRNFLGRNPTQEAFLICKGLQLESNL